MPELAIGGNFYVSESKPLSAQEAVNVYAVIPQEVTTTKMALFTTPGIESATTAGTEENRGVHNFNGFPYFVQGSDLYRVDRSIGVGGAVTYSSTKVNGATSLPGTADVIMADNGEEGGQMVIVCPDVDTKFNTYIYTTSAGLVAISDNDFDGPASGVVFVDGYFLFTKKTSQNFFISALRDGTSYNALDFGSAEADPDSIVGPAIIGNNVYIFGSETIEPFQNVGGSGFPFVRIPGGVVNKGLSSKYALAEVNDLLVFLGGAVNETPMIWVTDGSNPQKLSTRAIDREIRTYSDSTIEACFAWRYSQDGAQFVAFTFPGEKVFVYDFTSQLWHTRESMVGGSPGICRVSGVVAAYGVLLVGDLTTNKIGVLSRDVYTEYSETLQRRFVTPQLDNEGMPYFIDALELVCDTGEGLTSGQGSDPVVSLAVSRDGGRTFNNNLERKAGKMGEYDRRVVWGQLGRVAREACFRIQASDPIKWVFRKIEVQLE